MAEFKRIYLDVDAELDKQMTLTAVEQGTSKKSLYEKAARSYIESLSAKPKNGKKVKNG